LCAYDLAGAYFLDDSHECHMFDPAKWERDYPGIRERGELPVIPPFPWSDSVLLGRCPVTRYYELYVTHFIFLGLPIALGNPVSVTVLVATYGHWSSTWYSSVGEQPYLTEPACKPRWYLMPNETPKWTLNKTYDEQLALIPPDYEVATLGEFVAQLRLGGSYSLVPKPGQVRCSTTDPRMSGTHIGVIANRYGAWSIGPIPDDVRSKHVTIALSRKLPL